MVTLVASLTEREQQREASDEDQMTADSGPPTSFVQAAGGAESDAEAPPAVGQDRAGGGMLIPHSFRTWQPRLLRTSEIVICDFVTFLFDC